MASPDPKKWLEDSAEKFNIDDNFDFSKSDWAKSIIRYCLYGNRRNRI